jgi:hypothetical protein
VALPRLENMINVANQTRRGSLKADGLPPGLSASGDGRTQDDVVIRIQDAAPAAIWTAAVRYTAEQARLLLTKVGSRGMPGIGRRC